MKLIAFGCALLLLCGVILEVFLRSVLELGTPLLYIADDQIGYLLAPNQAVRRRGNRIVVNRYSMRGEDVEPQRSPATLRIFLLGDSIANGGWWTPQDQTISALSQKQWQNWAQEHKFTTTQVLNASANSWGPRNELAYLRQYGTFEAQVLILLINTDDLFATAPNPVKVGLDPNYPDRQPVLALGELYHRYLRARAVRPTLEALNQEKGDRVGFNLEAIQRIEAIATQANSQFILAHTPLLRELGTPGPRDYEIVARQRLTDLAQSQGWLYIDFLEPFNTTDAGDQLYWDHIHLNTTGNQFVVEAIAKRAMILLESHFGSS
ncbi:MAG: SGNH/GDSL hydrolase family protein [Cyanothece sp. SIO2G6]|nr:SGNH/GDSL hydrolase family protein [Cyanothece sp. SIO2G6]